ncbi:hypothetical protein DSM104443_03157 [Usitatibacter rugosus]|uniref:Choice-of-anchor D domain-containing protein n=1 Tax=Usitatibacter rugosus TaxID=2732067 RepID=A0A6M4H021_9PROT|nr:choice-of-anchor D domain-containing protein [Usitatibacter rugosus]QJR12074.1 hypothetical protein DSM104443_03157 [Usitatibacter rugosus]
MASLVRLAVLSLLLLFALPALAVNPVSGKTSWAIVLCKFKDIPAEPFTVKDAEIFFTEAGKGQGMMFDFWRDMSFGKVDLTGSKVFGWFDLPLTFDEFNKLGGEPPAGRDEKLELCRKAAKGVKLDDFYGTVVVWNDDRGEFWGTTKRVALTPSSLVPAAAGHEMGHGYGMNHSMGWPRIVYGDPWDTMSFARVHTFMGSGGKSGPGLNASYRALLEWLDPRRIVDVTPGPLRAVRLDSVSFEAGTDMHMARIRLTPDEHLDVELRTQDGWDAGIPEPVVLVHRVGLGHVTLLERNAGGSYDLQPGERYYDAAYDVQVRVRSIDFGNAKADIEIGPTGPTVRASLHPQPNGTGWNTTDVEVRLEANHPVPRYTAPEITFDIEGADFALPSTQSAFTILLPLRTEGISAVNFAAVDKDGNLGDEGRIEIAIDKTPPLSHATLVPTSAGFQARIVATDATSGVREIRYNLGGLGPDQVVAGSAATVLLNPSGWSTLLYWAVDQAGNVEYPYHQLTVSPHLEVTPSAVSLTAPVGAWGTPGIVTLRNSGVSAMNIVSVMTDSYYFRVIPGSTCVGRLGGGQACDLRVEFFAPAAFAYDATLYIRTDDIHQLDHTVALHGEGKVPGLTFNPSPVVFANVTIGTVGGSYARATIGNSSGAPVVISNLYTGTGTFLIFGDTCGPKPYTLASGASCYVDMLFMPGVVGPHSGSLQVASNVPSGPQSVPLQGMATGTPTLTAVPNPVAFGMVPVGQSGIQQLKIRNTGTMLAFVDGFTIAGANPAMFRIIKSMCQNGVPPTTIEPGQACEFVIAYLPTASATHQAVLRANLSMGVAPFDVPMSGMAR